MVVPRAAGGPADGVSAVFEPALAIAAGVVVALVVAAVVAALFRAAARRWRLAGEVSRRVRRPLRVLLVIIGVWVAVRLSTTPSSWTPAVEHALTIALIITVAWLFARVALVVEDAIEARYPVDVPDNSRARRVHTQIHVLRRLTAAGVVLVATAAVLLTFPGMRTFGASLLASAGLISIVAGLAAQTSLANVFAGMQIAFTDAIRVGDVVVVAGEWGRIEEITMTYVVVHIWDDRRLILPSTYFATTPFENWTRRDADLLGTVELDVDWSVPVEAMRAEMHLLLADTDLWDQRVAVLQVTDAVGGFVRVRALASAVDAPTLFDLRCYLREGLVAWLRHQEPAGLPRTRLETVLPSEPQPPAPASEVVAEVAPGVAPGVASRLPETAPAEVERRSVRQPMSAETRIGAFGSDARLFTGSLEAIRRSRPFAGPGQDVIDEREQAAERSGDETQRLPPWPAPADGGDTRGHDT
jgi:small-conductance mechanosensitive channel